MKFEVTGKLSEDLTCAWLASETHVAVVPVKIKDAEQALQVTGQAVGEIPNTKMQVIVVQTNIRRRGRANDA